MSLGCPISGCHWTADEGSGRSCRKTLGPHLDEIDSALLAKPERALSTCQARGSWCSALSGSNQRVGLWQILLHHPLDRIQHQCKTAYEEQAGLVSSEQRFVQ
jgi:hypothetical protein